MSANSPIRPMHACGGVRSVVLAILLAAVAVWIAVSTITHSGTVHPAPSGATSGASGGAGAAVFDAGQADAELQALQQKVNAAMKASAIGVPLQRETQQYVQRYPRYAPGRVLWGQVLLFNGQYERAYEQLSAALELDNAQPAIHELAGAVAERLGNIDRAGWHYSQAMSLDASEPSYGLKLANIYLKQRQYDQAKELVLASLRLDSNQHLAYAFLSEIYADQSKLDLALDQIQKAIEHTPSDQPDQQTRYVRRRSALLRRANRSEEALQVLQGLPRDRQLDAAVLADMATCWAMLGQPKQAAQMYEAALADQPTDWQWVAEAAAWWIKAGDRQAAARHLQTLQTLNPQAPQIPELRAKLAQGAATQP